MKAVHVALLATLMTTCFLATSVDALKCHVCKPNFKDPNSCNATDLGVEVDGCAYCYVEQFKFKQFKRLCMPLDESIMSCQIDKGLKSCTCNSTDLCNKVPKPLITCFECSFVDDETSCTNKLRGRLNDQCYMCQSVKANDNSWVRACLPGDDIAQGCRLRLDLHTCFCDTDKCNDKDIPLPTMKCYVCKPKSDSDTSCNAANSGSVQDGCLTCRLSIDSRKITTRTCMIHARGPSRKEEDGKTIIECSADLCNGEGDTASRGLQKTVSSRVLISGITTAMLGLAQLF